MRADLHLSTLRDLYAAELRELLYLENADEVIAGMTRVAHAGRLRELLKEAAGQSKRHARVLESVLSGVGAAEPAGTRQGAIGMVEMGRQVASDGETSAVLDAALVVCLQKMAHYKMAAYGSVRSFAGILGDVDTHARLQECLNDEADIDRRLTQLAEDSLNVLADARASDAPSDRLPSNRSG